MFCSFVIVLLQFEHSIIFSLPSQHSFENSLRRNISQVAKRFFNQISPKGYKATSAGTKPVPNINPVAVEIMKVGIEVSIEIFNESCKVFSFYDTVQFNR